MKFRSIAAATLAAAALALGTVSVAPAAQAAGNCYVDSNGSLHCANGASDLRSAPFFSSPVVSKLTSTYSYFNCWTRGDAHSGGNDVWYYTDGDDGGHGYLPAQRVYTPQDPMPGMYHC
jgi:hypothetical protein